MIEPVLLVLCGCMCVFVCIRWTAPAHDAAIHTYPTRPNTPKRQLVALMAAYPGLSKEEAARALRVKAAVVALRRRGWDVGSALGELTAR